MILRNRVVLISAVSLVVAATAGCTALPDTSGYTAASFQLKNSAAAAGSVLQSELGRMTEQLPADHRERAASVATRFGGAWESTVRSLDGMARYAESIEEVTKAGNSGGESARAVAGSVSALAGAIGIVPGAALVGVATDTFAMLNTALANMRAARSLERSLAIAEPLIEDFSNVVGGQVATARDLYGQAIALQREALDFGVDDIAPLEASLAALEVEEGRTLAALSADSSRDAERRVHEANLKRIRDGRAAIAPRINAYNAAREALETRQRAGRELFDATERALAAWRESHEKMVRAIRERRPVSFQSLLAASEDIRGLIERWRDL